MMKELIAQEPIIPFTDRVRELYEQLGVSTILVIGGSGEYLNVADHIYLMEQFMPVEVTQMAQELGEQYASKKSKKEPASWVFQRTLNTEHFSSRSKKGKGEILEIWDKDFIFIGDERIETRMLHHVATSEQNAAIGLIIRRIMNSVSSNELNLMEALDQLYDQIYQDGLEVVFSNYFYNCCRFLDLPRKEEVLGAIYRMRRISFHY